MKFHLCKGFCWLWVDWCASLGVPSLFVLIKPLLADDEKRKVIAAMVDVFYHNLLHSNRFDSDSVPNSAVSATSSRVSNLSSFYFLVNGSDPPSPPPPSAILWLLYFKAQLLQHLRLYSQALAVIDEAIEHTPTMVELYMMKARIYKVGRWLFPFDFCVVPLL